MNTTDLMVGDWIDRFGKPPYYKVLAINSCTTEVTIAQSEEDEETMRICWEDKLDPIPLTPEILERNGFHEEWDEDIKLMVCDTIIVETGDNYKLYKDGKMYLRRVLAPLYYVHQLQHALRLCGINKKIIL